MDRKTFALRHLDMKGKGLEIGASYNPLFPKKDGYTVKTLDHLSREDLCKKYQGDKNVDLAKIEDVDFVWKGEEYDKLVGEERFDWIFAAHLIEHVPNIVAFINDAATILKEDGVLCLVIPDKRYTFDMYRPQSSIASVIDAHVEQRKIPTLGSRFEYMFSYGSRNQKTSSIENIVFPLLPHGDIKQTMLLTSDDSSYTDVHVWSFTPNHFRLLIEVLFQTKLISLREQCFHPSVGHEFYITLSASGNGPGCDIRQLFKAALAEARHPFLSGGRGTHWFRIMVAALDRHILGGSLRTLYRKIRAGS